MTFVGLGLRQIFYGCLEVIKNERIHLIERLSFCTQFGKAGLIADWYLTPVLGQLETNGSPDKAGFAEKFGTGGLILMIVLKRKDGLRRLGYDRPPGSPLTGERIVACIQVTI